MDKQKDKSEVIDLGAIFETCRRKWYVFVVSFIVCVGIGFVYTRTHNPKYLVKADIMIKSDSSESFSGLGSLSSIFGSNANVDDELFAVSSHSVLRDVAKNHKLNIVSISKTGLLSHKFDFEDSPIGVEFNPAITDTLRTTLVFKVKVNDKGLASVKVKARKQVLFNEKNQKMPVNVSTDYGEFKIVATSFLPADESVNTTIFLSGYDEAAENLAKELVIDIPNRKASVIDMQLVSENIDYAKLVLNSVIKQYNQRAIFNDNVEHQNTLDFLNKRLALLAADLSEVESDLVKTKTNQGVVDIGAEMKYQFLKKSELEGELLTAQTKYEVLKLVRDFLADPANSSDLVPAGLLGSDGNSAESDAIAAYNDLVLERMRIASTASQGNTALRTIDSQLAAMRANLITTLNKSLETSKVSLNELRNNVGNTKNAIGQIPDQERVMRSIMRQREIKEQLYLFLLQERERVSMQLANGKEKGLVIDEAYALTEEVGMSNKMILAVSGFLGILLGCIILYVQNILRTKFTSRHELEGLTPAPILGEICQDRSGDALVVSKHGSSSTAELFRLVRSNLMFMLGNKNDKVVLMTSTKSGEGKSYVSINLAASLAVLGKKVLLVGLDIRKPQLANYLKLPAVPGFTNYIAGGDVSVEQVIHKNALIPGLDIVVAGPVPPNPSELLVSTKVDEFFHAVRDMYDYIIIDSAPVGIVSDSFALTRVADATVYVCRANFTTKADIRLFDEFYNNKRFPKVGLVLNGIRTKQGYGYGYGSKTTETKK